jgi:predicted PurR-regulated permease PerM
MTLQKQLSFWFLALLVLIAVLWLLSDIMLPFIAGLALAYFLDPVADMLERWGLPRLAATSIILAVSLLIFAVLLLALVPMLSDQVANFAEKLPQHVATLTNLFNEIAPDWLKQALNRANLKVPDGAADIAAKVAQWIAKLLSSLISGGLALVNLISLLVVTPIVVFYMLNDWDRLVAKIDSWLPRDHVDTIRSIANDVDKAMAGFIRGQGTVCMALGIFYALALIAVGLNFGLLIGLTSGALSFIPYVGSIIGGVLSIGMAMVQFWPDWVIILMVAGIFAVGQFLEGNFLSPKLVGGSIGLHPVWLMFALFAFGYLFGFVGLLLAVPMAAAAGVLVRFALSQYLASPLYKGVKPHKAAVKRKPASKKA